MNNWPCYIINLPDATERMSQAAAQCAQHGIAFERIIAVDGRKLSNAEIDKVYDVSANRQKARKPLTPSEIGCYLSHYKLWQRIAEDNAEGAFVFEDDFLAQPHLPLALDALMRDKNDWDMVKLFAGRRAGREVRRISISEGVHLVESKRIPNCMIAYAIRREGARRLVETMLPIIRQVDEQLKFFWEHDLSIKLILPAPITYNKDTIGMSNMPKHYLADLRSPFAQLWHNIKYQLMLSWNINSHHRKFN